MVQFSFPVIQVTLGWGPTFCLFSIILAFAVLFIKWFVPETAGLTLEEIQQQLSKPETLRSRKHNNVAADFDPSSEQSPLLGMQTKPPVFGAILDEMESQIVRRHSETALYQGD